MTLCIGTAGDLVEMFKACNLAFKHDVQTARFLLPYIVHNALACGSVAALETVKAEMELVMQRGPATREGELCVQEVWFPSLSVFNKASGHGALCSGDKHGDV